MKIRCILSAAAFVFMSAFTLHAGAWELAWADSFNTYTGLPDPAKWAYETGASGWGNNELENYTANRLENARVDSGNLIIEARNDNYQNHQYSSVRLHSTGTGNWTYGRFEIRAKLPFGKGTWPAIWMMPTGSSYGGWPSSGEIDIMEHVGSDQGVIHFSTHCLKYYFKIGNQKTATLRVPDCSTAFHVYALEWTADTIRGYVDTTRYFTNVNEHSGWQAWPFDKPFHFIFNIAIGGGWGGPVDNSIFPQRMYIDYAKVYRYNPTTSAVKTEMVSETAAKTSVSIVNTRSGLQVNMPLSGRYTVTVCAIDGRRVVKSHGTGASGVINTTMLRNGIYIVRIAGSWGEFKSKVVVGQ
jgi:beta-glucanase (GH16 family)